MTDQPGITEKQIASRREFLSHSLKVGVAVVAVTGVAALNHEYDRNNHHHQHNNAPLAHGGALHSDLHGGIGHVHNEIGHNHAPMVHALDVHTLRAVDDNTR